MFIVRLFFVLCLFTFIVDDSILNIFLIYGLHFTCYLLEMILLLGFVLRNIQSMT